MSTTNDIVEQALFEMEVILPASVEAFRRYDSATLREGLREIIERAINSAVETQQADYAMLRGVARRAFTEQTEQSMRDLWQLADTVDHPGVALNIRWNRAKTVIAAARLVMEQGAIGGYSRLALSDALAVFDLPLTKD